MTKRYVEVGLTSRSTGSLYYRIPDRLCGLVEEGDFVLVPLRTYERIGCIERLFDEPPQLKSGIELREIIDRLSLENILNPEAVEELTWIARYYGCTKNQALKSFLPPGFQLRIENHLLRVDLPNIDITFYEAVEVGDLGLRASETRQLYEYLCGKPPISRSDLEFQFPHVAAKLRRLIELGLVRTVQKRKEISSTGSFLHILKREDKIVKLTEEQQSALKPILESLDSGKFVVHLLHGVTGSGKTEVYLRAIAEVLAKGKEAIFLVPEISLTPQVLSIIFARFGNQIALIHSRMSDGERSLVWHKIDAGEVKISIGARSAIFSPFRNLGLIIVDEEHDRSYKQDNSLLYNARDFAVMKGKIRGIPVVIGSATPSIESYHNAVTAKYGLAKLTRRVDGARLPVVEPVNLRSQEFADKEILLSKRLAEEIEATLIAGKKTILFLNRRGYSSCTICVRCGYAVHCPDCFITMKYHLNEDRLICHYCDRRQQLPSICPDCFKEGFVNLGIGTERLEKGIKTLFPLAKTVRIDADSVSGKYAYFEVHRLLTGADSQIIIGTQMIAKGLDIPEITLVGVVFPDQDLHLPDFRAGERLFQLLTQVAGRAGRGQHPGRVLIQSYCHEHPSLRLALSQDYEAFYAEEVVMREAAGYPPFGRLCLLRLSGPDQEKLHSFSGDVGFRTREIRRAMAYDDLVDLLGPVASPLTKLHNRYRYQMLLKSSRINAVQHLAKTVFRYCEKDSQRNGIRLSIDIDPLHFL